VKEPDHRFIWYLCEKYQKLPDDIWFEEIDPVMWLWMYESWCRDVEEKNEFAKSYAILQGSFVNPDMARKMIKSENPDFESTDEDYEKLSRQMIEDNRKTLRRRKRKLLVNTPDAPLNKG
jgi:hypothetical protein